MLYSKLEVLTLSQGGSANRAQEYIVQAMYLNVLHDLQNLAPAAALFHGASQDRLGMCSAHKGTVLNSSDSSIGLAQLADRSYELAVAVNNTHCSLNDRIRSSCRLALASAKSGHHSKAVKMLSDLSPIAKGVLKLEQRIQAFAAIVQMRRQLRR